MKKIKSIWMVVIFVISIFSVVDVSSATNLQCCEKKGIEYCVDVLSSNIDECDSGYPINPLICSQVNNCDNVCCVDEDGNCFAEMTKAQCVDSGGTVKDDSDCSSYDICDIGMCVIRNQCTQSTFRGACKKQADRLDLDWDFDTEIESLAECYTQMTGAEGCCVLSDNNCIRTKANSCSGNFEPRKLCSHDDLIGYCDNEKTHHKSCHPNGEDVYWYDSKNQLENMVGVGWAGGMITYADGNYEGDCDIVNEGTKCGLENEEYKCVDINCDVGDVFTIQEVNPVEGVTGYRDIDITKEMLGGVNSRKNGESWCIISYYERPFSGYNADWSDWGTLSEYDEDGQFVPELHRHARSLHQKYSFGSRHYKRYCSYGQIKVESCGVERDKSGVCLEGKKLINGKEFRVAECVDNGAKKCIDIGTDDDKCKENNRWCVLNTENVNECWPKPEFVPAGVSKCSHCGKGWNDLCDDDECWSSGDCSTNKGHTVWEGIIEGAAWGATAVLLFTSRLVN